MDSIFCDDLLELFHLLLRLLNLLLLLPPLLFSLLLFLLFFLLLRSFGHYPGSLLRFLIRFAGPTKRGIERCGQALLLLLLVLNLLLSGVLAVTFEDAQVRESFLRFAFFGRTWLLLAKQPTAFLFRLYFGW